MEANRNEDEVSATYVRSSITIPPWMEAELSEIARRTFSSKAQVIRRLIAEGLERESAAPIEPDRLAV